MSSELAAIADDENSNEEGKSKYHYPSFSRNSPKQYAKKSTSKTIPGQVCSWGWGSNGQLGTGELFNVLTPRWVPQLRSQSVRKIVCGTRFTVMLTWSGGIFACGKNDHGQLGVGDRNNRKVPQMINQACFKGNVIEVSTRATHVIALTSEGFVYTWGRGSEGQLGHGVYQEELVPRRVKMGVPVRRIGAGRQHTVVLDMDGRIYSTGCSDDGQLGTGNTVSRSQFLPLDWPAERGRIRRLEVGSRHNLVLTDTDEIYSWGGNAYGQTGLGLTGNVLQPTLIPTLHNIWRVYCGYRHSLCISRSGEVFTWGWNAFGQLGLPGGSRSRPELVMALHPDNIHQAANDTFNNANNDDASDDEEKGAMENDDMCVVGAALGGKHTLVLLRSRQIYNNVNAPSTVLSFGQNNDGQLGLGNTASNIIPTEVHELRGEGVRLLSAGWCHSTAVTQTPLKAEGNARKLVTRPSWISRGDVDAFLALFMNSVIQIILVETLCRSIFGEDSKIASRRILPAIGVSVLLGNVIFAFQAHLLMQKEIRSNVTAQPFGVHIVLLLSYTMLIIQPVMKQTNDEDFAWAVGLFACFVTGAIECVGAFLLNMVRVFIPRPAMLSAIGGISMTFIAMQFTFQVMDNPTLAFAPLMIILISYGSGIKLPLGVPGALASVLLGIILAWGSNLMGMPYFKPSPHAYEFELNAPSVYGQVFQIMKTNAGWTHIAVILPMAIFNVVGNFVNIESASSAGDTYDSIPTLLVSGVGNMLMAILGSPYPGCIFIGHPVFKSMGAGISYGVIQGIIICILCFCNGATLILQFMPMEIAVGVLFWVGVVMTASAFEGAASPTKNVGVAVAIGFVPALASWGVQTINTALSAAGSSLYEVMEKDGFTGKMPIHGVISMSQGFLLISLIFSAIMVYIIERQFIQASVWCALGAVLSMVGMIHAYEIGPEGISNVFGYCAAPEFAFGYFLSAGILYLTHFTINDDDDDLESMSKVRQLVMESGRRLTFMGSELEDEFEFQVGRGLERHPTRRSSKLDTSDSTSSFRSTSPGYHTQSPPFRPAGSIPPPLSISTSLSSAFHGELTDKSKSSYGTTDSNSDVNSFSNSYQNQNF